MTMSNPTTVWESITENFKNLLEDSVTGIGSLTSVTNSFSEAKEDLQNISAQNYNGKYLLLLESLDSVEDLTTNVHAFYTVIWKVGFKLRKNFFVTDYNYAIQDVEQFSTLRVDPSTYSDPYNKMYNIQFINTTAMEFPRNTELETFGVISVRFKVEGEIRL